MFKYIHDQENKTVYKVPNNPTVHEVRDKKGKLTSWSIHMEVDITRADNVLRANQWKHPTSSYPRQHFDNRYDRDEAIHYFKLNNEPDGTEISEADYTVLQRAYEATARMNRD